MAELDDKFAAMVMAVRNATIDFKPNNTQKLKLYAFYKQATIGDVNVACPGVLVLVERAKWNAWNAIKGWSSEKAMQAYLQVFNEPA